MTTPDHDILLEVRADVKYMKERFENSFGRVEALERDYVSRSFLAKVLGGFFSVFLAVGEVLRVYHEK